MGIAQALSVAAVAALLAAAPACSDDETGSDAELCAVIGDGRGFASTFQDGLDPTDTDTALEQLRAGRVELGELRDVAPGDARDDITVLVDYVQALIEALEAVDPNDPAAAVAAVQATADEHAGVQESSDRMEAWVAATC